MTAGESAERVNRAPAVAGALGFATDQRKEILRLLREAGPTGVSKQALIFENHFTQCGARVFELEQQGYQIRHESRPGERYVYFVLIAEPEQPKTLPAFKKRMPDTKRAAGLPLFAGVENV